MRIACIIQARKGSTRLPNKVNMLIDHLPMIARVALRVDAAMPSAHDWTVAWPDVGYDENDVLGRYARKATEMALDAIIRVTGDCPLLDPQCITDVLCSFQTLLYDYVTNDYPRTYPCGLGVEIFSREVLDRTNKEATDPADREHVSLFMQRDKRNTIKNIACPIRGLSDLKLSVDTQQDLDFVRAIYAAKPRDYSLAATLEAGKRAAYRRPESVGAWALINAARNMEEYVKAQNIA